MVTLRSLTKDDMQYFLMWWRDTELIALTSGNHTPISDVQAQGYFDDMYQHPAHIHRMIEVNGITVGHISLIQHSQIEYELQTVIGDKGCQNKGYGAQAICQILQLAKEKGVKTVILYVRPENARAIHAYKKAGFNQTDGTIQTNNPNQPELVKMQVEL